jgi:hypothetical protein
MIQCALPPSLGNAIVPPKALYSKLINLEFREHNIGLLEPKAKK